MNSNMCVFGLWEEAGGPVENQQRQLEKMQTLHKKGLARTGIQTRLVAVCTCVCVIETVNRSSLSLQQRYPYAKPIHGELADGSSPLLALGGLVKGVCWALGKLTDFHVLKREVRNFGEPGREIGHVPGYV